MKNTASEIGTLFSKLLGHERLKEDRLSISFLKPIIKTTRQIEQMRSGLEATVEHKDKLHIGKSKGGIVVKGIHDVAVRFSKCCNPIPGDEIVGYVTRGRGVTIHRTDCINVMNMSAEDRNRLIDAGGEYLPMESCERYMADINVFAYNRTGLIVDISKIFTERKNRYSYFKLRISMSNTTINICFEVRSK